VKPFFTDPSPAGLLVHAALWILLSAAGLAMATDRDADPGPPVLTVAEVEAGIAWFVRAAQRVHPLARNLKLARKRAEQVVDVSAFYAVPNSLVLAIAIRESGLHTSALDSKGAAGLMQVSPCNVAKLRCEMKTAVGQLHCGCRVLRMGFDKCGTWAGAVTYYASRDETCIAKRGTRLAWVAKDRLRLADRIAAR